ncbi:DUF262 domain-containing protein [Streptomyces sp. NPDC002838]|uniref:DUF262 domain-containing protein n=1 Tax=Streptomyces sp. NPDC002838 TaxID=3154436 RepID=UPI003327CD54
MSGLEHEVDPRGALFERPVEVGTNGQPTGVELELPPDEPERRSHLDPKNVGIETVPATVDRLLSRYWAGRIDLAPDFHRRAGMWSDAQQSRFVESLLLGIPVAPFHMAQQSGDVWSVVLGVQELTALARFVGTPPDELPPLRLTGLEYMGSLEGATFRHLSGRMRIRLLEVPLVVHLVRQTTSDAVKFNVFSRVSASGPQLAPQEIRHAMMPGPARELLADLAEHPAFGQATGFGVSNERMADRELVLRFLAFRLTGPLEYRQRRYDFEQFLTAAMRQVNELSEEQRREEELKFLRAMETAHRLFGDQAFRRSLGHKRKLPVNKALFEAIAVNLATLDDHERKRLVASRDEVRAGLFAHLTGNFAFERALTVAPGDPDNVWARFDVVRELFKEVLRGD